MRNTTARIVVRSAAVVLSLGLGLGVGFSSAQAKAAPAIGAPLAAVTLSGEAGGRVDGQPWTSAALKDKVWVVFYIAPSHRDDNQELKDALSAANFPDDKYATTAVINMASSWLPNSVLNSALKGNQEKYPKVTYVKDMNKALVKQWHMADDAFALVVLNQQGQVIAAKEGDLSKDDISTLVTLIKKTIAAH